MASTGGNIGVSDASDSTELAASASDVTGNSNQNVEPRSASLTKPIAPPINSTPFPNHCETPRGADLMDGMDSIEELQIQPDPRDQPAKVQLFLHLERFSE